MGQIYRGIPTGLLTGAADRKLLDSLGLRLILDLRSESEAAEQPDYVPDGARLVRICGLCHPDGSEISFSPGDIEKLLKGKKDEEHNLADAMYEQMLFRNKAYKELFRALEAGETPILFHCSGGKDRTGVAAMLILLALGASDETICQDFIRTNVCRRPELERSGPPMPRRSRRIPNRSSSIRALPVSTRSLPPLCWTPSAKSTAPPMPISRRNTA